MVKIYRSSASKRDIADIVAFVAKENRGAARDLLTRLDRAVRALGDTPQMGPVHPELRGSPRGIVVHPYVVLYHEDSRGVRIMRILDGRRDLPNTF